MPKPIKFIFLHRFAALLESPPQMLRSEQLKSHVNCTQKNFALQSDELLEQDWIHSVLKREAIHLFKVFALQYFHGNTLGMPDSLGL